MMGLIRKDLMVLKKYLRTLTLLIVFYALIFLPTAGSAAMTGILAFLSSMMIITIMSYDDQAKWDKYALSMPFARKDIVRSRYLFLLLTSAAGTLCGVLIGLIYGLVTNTLKPASLFGEAVGCISIAWLFGAIMIPLLIRFGVEKARYLMILVFLIPAVIGFGGAALFKSMGLEMPSGQALDQILVILAYTLPFAVLAIGVGSYFLSLRLYRKKEF